MECGEHISLCSVILTNSLTVPQNFGNLFVGVQFLALLVTFFQTQAECGTLVRNSQFYFSDKIDNDGHAFPYLPLTELKLFRQFIALATCLLHLHAAIYFIFLRAEVNSYQRPLKKWLVVSQGVCYLSVQFDNNGFRVFLASRNRGYNIRLLHEWTLDVQQIMKNGEIIIG